MSALLTLFPTRVYRAELPDSTLLDELAAAVLARL